MLSTGVSAVQIFPARSCEPEIAGSERVERMLLGEFDVFRREAARPWRFYPCIN